MAAPEIVYQLVERFERNLPDYRAGNYKEEQLRIEFVNPFFEALGWDVNNRNGYAEAYKDVVHEDALKIGATMRAPDYSFRVGGVRKFFVETKKPSVDIRGDVAPAYQLRRYAWSAKLPLSVLTDFEEFAVYDTRIKPNKTDRSATARTEYFEFRDYPERWDRIAGVFSREAILKGSFDRYAEATKGKRGTEEVGDAFLEEIERWRQLLAQNIALRNRNLTPRELNFAVQRTIDRIVFLRICEDRGIELYRKLFDLTQGGQVYTRLLQEFHAADARYNSGLFHFSKEKGRHGYPDELTPAIQIDDKPLKDIIRHLYYPDSPYEFSVLPADILGQVYERFLGKVIVLDKRRRATIEEKPEVRKAGGVYYTPTYIVEYIVENTIGKLVEGKDWKQVREMRFLDPACGSGSFLIGAYDYLLDWHLKHYLDTDPESHARGRPPRMYQDAKGEWRLTTQERKRILLDNIYGVDIDRQAVEVTKLSLLLKVLEGENTHSLDSQLAMFRERALPDLTENIKCGNSLIGSDFFDGQLFDDELMYQVNAFDWRRSYADIFRQGGFDAVIGNPPYVRQELLSGFKLYFQQQYETYSGTADLYVYFIEKSLDLLKQEGFFGMIIANKWMRASYGKPLRQWLRQKRIEEIIDFTDLPVFQDASTYPAILRISKSKPGQTLGATIVNSLEALNLSAYTDNHRFQVPFSTLQDDGWSLIDVRPRAVQEKVRNAGIPLSQYMGDKAYFGIKTGLNEAFVIDETIRRKLVQADPKSAERIKPYLRGRDLKRYQPPLSRQYLILFPRGWTKQHHSDKDEWSFLKRKYPAIAEYLAPFETKATKRTDRGDFWWELRACSYYDVLNRPKILFPDISTRGNFTMDKSGQYCTNTVYFLPSEDLYLLGLLNSKLMTFYYRNAFAVYRGGYLRFFSQYVEELPVKRISVDHEQEKTLHGQIVSLVDRMLTLQAALTTLSTSYDREMIERQIHATDQQIDRLVYELYGLTEDEIAVVESSRN